MSPEMRTETKPEETLFPTEPVPEPLGGGLSPLEDDIPDPDVPLSVVEAVASRTPDDTQAWKQHEALLQGFCQHLQARLTQFLLEEHTGVMKNLDMLSTAMRTWGESVSHHNEHAQYSLSDTLAKFQEQGLVIVESPYQARLQVRTPAGYPLTLTVTRPTSSALIEELGRLEPWLQSNGYTSAS